MLRLRDEGSERRDGVVLNMTLSGDGVWNAIYSVQVYVGKNQQRLTLSVDTGSSDIWLASNTCSTSACSSAHTSLYDPSTSNQTGESVSLSYLRGSASGPVVWDSFKIGPYTIPYQALAAANQVADEALSPDFVGLLGLALPPNSRIAQIIPPTLSDSPDGATLQQNLFGLTPDDTAPQQRFFGLSFERPGSSRIPSLLSIGRHPSSLFPGFDPSNVSYTNLVASRAGDTFWRIPVGSITAWVDGVPKPISLKRSTTVEDVSTPVAIVDSGGSLILATRDIANGIYGAWSIGPGSDGNYYVPCTTPLNLSIGLGRFSPIPLHPLDISAYPPSSSPSSDTSTCLGVIQASESLDSLADLVLGVPFLRNVYTVLSSSSSSNASSPPSESLIFPRLGLLSITDPTTAMNEFHSVRVLGQPLEPSARPTHETSSVTVGKKLSLGVTVLLGIVGFFVACGALFTIRWWILRRRFRGKQGTEDVALWEQKLPSRDRGLDEDALRNRKWEEGKKRGLYYAESSVGSDWTRVDPASALEDRGARLHKEGEDARPTSRSRSRSPFGSLKSGADIGHENPVQVDTDGWGATSRPVHVRTVSEMGATGVSTVPLLDEGENGSFNPYAMLFTHDRIPSSSSAAATVTFQDDIGMAGIGTRGSVASNWKRVPRPAGARGMSNGSNTSSMGSRTWSLEVGQVLDHAEVPWSTNPEKTR